MKTNKDIIQEDCIEFFNMLIELTATYFLSDYVEDVREYNELGVERCNSIISQRDILKKQCEDFGLDFHQISIQVAEKFLIKEGIID